MIRVEVKWDFSDITHPMPEDVLGTTIFLKALGYTWEDLSDLTKADRLHDDIARSQGLPTKVDIPVSLDDLVELPITLHEYITSNLLERFKFHVSSWNQIKD